MVSEPLEVEPDPFVVARLDAQTLEASLLCMITSAETCFGVTRLPSERRLDTLIEQREGLLVPSFAGRVLHHDMATTPQFTGAQVTPPPPASPRTSPDFGT